MTASLLLEQAEHATVLRVRSISLQVWEWLAEGPAGGRVLASFERACLLTTAAGYLVSLVSPEIGNGPFNVVLEGRHEVFSSLRTGALATFDKKRIQAEQLEAVLQEPLVWDPRPAWENLRARHKNLEAQMPLLHHLGWRYAVPDSLLQLLPRTSGLPETAQKSLPDALAGTAREGLNLVRQGMAGDPEALQRGAARLAGLGMGLTPAGDDFLCGLMLWAWLAHPAPGEVCDLVLGAAKGRTTALSAAFLRAAAGGQCSEPWHELLAALPGGEEAVLEGAVQEVLASGSTSGSDTLAGFLLMAAGY